MKTDEERSAILNAAEQEILEVLRKYSLSMYPDDSLIFLSHESQHDSGDWSFFEQSINFN